MQTYVSRVRTMKQGKINLGVLGLGTLLTLPATLHAADYGGISSAHLTGTFSGQRASAYEHFGLLTTRDGSLKRSATMDAGSIGNSLVGASYNALSKAQLYSVTSPDYPYRKVSSSSGAGSDVLLARAAHAPSASLPQTYAMFLAGLGLIATVIKRRLRSF